jgi:hypothetical protein
MPFFVVASLLHSFAVHRVTATSESCSQVHHLSDMQGMHMIEHTRDWAQSLRHLILHFLRTNSARVGERQRIIVMLLSWDC